MPCLGVGERDLSRASAAFGAPQPSAGSGGGMPDPKGLDPPRRRNFSAKTKRLEVTKQSDATAAFHSLHSPPKPTMPRCSSIPKLALCYVNPFFFGREAPVQWLLNAMRSATEGSRVFSRIRPCSTSLTRMRPSRWTVNTHFDVLL